MIATAAGVQRVADDQIAGIVDQVVAARMQRPDGPGAPLL